MSKNLLRLLLLEALYWVELAQDTKFYLIKIRLQWQGSLGDSSHMGKVHPLERNLQSFKLLQTKLSRHTEIQEIRDLQLLEEEMRQVPPNNAPILHQLKIHSRMKTIQFRDQIEKRNQWIRMMYPQKNHLKNQKSYWLKIRILSGIHRQIIWPMQRAPWFLSSISVI